MTGVNGGGGGGFCIAVNFIEGNPPIFQEFVKGKILLDNARVGPEIPPMEGLLQGSDRDRAISIIRSNHYTHSVPSGKSHYVQFGEAIVVWSIPANKNIARFLLGWPGNVWELSRLWAPDGHEKNLLTQAIKSAVKIIKKLENPDALVSYADPNAGHEGGVYRAASWICHGRSEEVRTYRNASGQTFARRAFHSGRRSLKKSEIEALGYSELKLPGKVRFVRPLSKRARKFCNTPTRV